MSGWFAAGALAWLLLEFALFGRVHPWSLALLCTMGVAVVLFDTPVINSWPSFKG